MHQPHLLKHTSQDNTRNNTQHWPIGPRHPHRNISLQITNNTPQTGIHTAKTPTHRAHTKPVPNQQQYPTVSIHLH